MLIQGVVTRRGSCRSGSMLRSLRSVKCASGPPMPKVWYGPHLTVPGVRRPADLRHFPRVADRMGQVPMHRYPFGSAVLESCPGRPGSDIHSGDCRVPAAEPR